MVRLQILSNKDFYLFLGLKETMLISKEKIKAHIDGFEEEAITVDALIERLIFIEKLEKRMAISANENSTKIPHEEVKNRISQ